MAKFDLSGGGIRMSRKSGQKRLAPTKEQAREQKNPASAGEPDASAELSMSVSPVCGEPGNMYAFVRFSDALRYCEYRFPNVELKVNDGFSDEELVQLQFYVKTHLAELKQMAASVNPLKALMRE